VRARRHRESARELRVPDRDLDLALVPGAHPSL
jgi:hypothetical protein